MKVMKNFKNYLLERFQKQALKVSVVKTNGKPKLFTYMRAVGTKELEKILADAFETLDLTVDTPLGQLKITETTDPQHPGLSIDLLQPNVAGEIPLVLVEYCGAEDADADLPAKEQLITRVWGQASKEDYTDRIVHNLKGDA